MITWLAVVVLAATLLSFAGADRDDIVNLSADFNKIYEDDKLKEYVQEILERLATFKVAVHPRIRLFYQLLKRAMARYAEQAADSLYVPYQYSRDEGDSMNIEP